MAPSASPPGGLAVSDAPMFVTIGFDDNGYSGLAPDGGLGEGFAWATNFFRDLVNPGQLGDGTYGGEPARVTFFMTSVYATTWMSESPTFVKRAWRVALEDGHEIGNHTELHHDGKQQDFAWWFSQIQICNDALALPFDPNEPDTSADATKGIGIAPAEILGFRTPFLKFNDNTFAALMSEDFYFLYDASLQEGWQPDQDGTDYLWPYTLDNGSPGHETMVSNEPSVNLPITNRPGLWELPLHALIVPPPELAADYGVPATIRADIQSRMSWFDTGAGKITALDYNMWVLAKMYKEEFLATLKYTFDLRMQGNRAPMMLGMHTDEYSSKYAFPPNTSATERQWAIEEFIKYVLTHEDARVVPYRDIMGWMQSPVALPSN